MRLKTNKPLRKQRPHRSKHSLYMEAELLAAKFSKHAARLQGRCQHPDCKTPWAPWEAHHVCYEQHIRALGLPRWNTDNVLRLCKTCHLRHHQRIAPVPLTALKSHNYAYAFRVMGERAFEYLPRRYDGADPRLHVYLRAWKDANP